MSDNASNFRRMTDPLLLPVAPTATQFNVPDGFFMPEGPGFGSLSFWVCNANNFWVRLKGSGNGALNTGSYTAVTATTGWLFPPGFTGSFSTQYPLFMSTISIARQGLPAGSGVLEVSYGGGA